MPGITFLDTEVNVKSGAIQDIGATDGNGSVFHSSSLDELRRFVSGSEYLCGHNIIDHDKRFLGKWMGEKLFAHFKFIDTLYLSPLLFPEKPYHHLVKDDKLDPDNLNNPYIDATRAMELFDDEVSQFRKLDQQLQQIYLKLLGGSEYFKSFFSFIQLPDHVEDVEKMIRTYFQGRFCSNKSISKYIGEDPVALAYALALITCDRQDSITPPWVLHHFPSVEHILFTLRSDPCIPGCSYCNRSFDAMRGLKEFFGFPSFKVFDGKPLQEEAVNAALQNKSILVIFPTGGGKSLTYQVPALMAGKNSHALTVIISPLQSLMKDQVDNLEKYNITDAVTINRLLDPIERAKSIERIRDGLASILYISPEALRSKTIENLLLGRKIARFVIDEAHCFSSWGHDFRVDYLYIAEFLKSLQDKKNLPEAIPVSCFTATAKPQVIEDIQSYFKDKLQLDLELYRTASTRKNLQYQVYPCKGDKEKYQRLRELIDSRDCPTIVYVSRVRRTEEIAERLTGDGYRALPYHGKMDAKIKAENQNAFMTGERDIMVATSAFGMGVDKDNVGMVVHYDISDSLESYVQEAGRAGRDERISAECFVLFNEDDLTKHFILLNQTKIGIHEIQEIWKAVKEMTRQRESMSNSALEISRKAGWNEQVKELETRVTTAVAALEQSGYLKRIHNSPRIYATGILAKNADEAIMRINASEHMDEKEKMQAIRIMKQLIASRSRQRVTDEVAESRVDYISDNLGIGMKEAIRVISLLREEGILADTRDLTVSFTPGQNESKSLALLKDYAGLEKALLEEMKDYDRVVHIKEVNEQALNKGIASNPNRIRTLLNFWSVKSWINKEKREGSNDHFKIRLKEERDRFSKKIEMRHILADFIIRVLFGKVNKRNEYGQTLYVEFSIHEIKKAFEERKELFSKGISIYDVEDTLFYLTRIEALTIEGGFLVVYNKLNIQRLEPNFRRQYRADDYLKLKTHYEHKTQQIHIVGEYAKKMLQDYSAALGFVDDYFRLNYSSFLNKYFPGSRKDEIRKTITPAKFKKLFGELSAAQLAIVNNKEDQILVTAAGPGSGKTKLLVHKLAAIVTMEDVKYEKLLMLTFSRAAVNEFKSRLMELIGNAARFIEIKTFHSYCFDLLGRVGNLERSEGIIKEAVGKIKNGQVEHARITKEVLVIDEAQDMDLNEFELIRTLMTENPEMRVIAVGDDDQNIYEFRGSDNKHFRTLMESPGARKYELVENFRSLPNLVEFTNVFARNITTRMKSTEIRSIHRDGGIISIYKHSSEQIMIPVVDQICQAELEGTTCLLTRTNDEALQLVGLLKSRGMPARLIQTLDGFDLLKLQEVRYVFDLLEKKEDHQTLDDGNLESAKRSLRDRFGANSTTDLIVKAVETFQRLHPATKYRSDFEQFFAESNLEDFIESGRDTILVATMHKAKGREFDNVYLMLNHFVPNNDEDRRLLYVAMTRAKNMLEIHYNDDYLEGIDTDGIQRVADRTDYPMPDELSKQLTHKDVHLGYFEFVKRRVDLLKPGDILRVNEEGCTNKAGDQVLRFSASMKQELQRLQELGFRATDARVVFLVYWYCEEKSQEFLVVLPEIGFKRVDNK